MTTTGRLVAVALLAMAAAGCGRARVRECKALVEKINAGDEAVTRAGGAGDPAGQLRTLATAVDTARADVLALQLDDTKLASLRAEYATMLRSVAGVARKVAVDATSKDNDALAADSQQLQSAIAKEAGIVHAVNAYCRRPR